MSDERKGVRRRFTAEQKVASLREHLVEKPLLSLDDARRIASKFVGHYDTVRLYSAIHYITPADKLAGRGEAVLATRDAKLAAARQAGKTRRRQERIPA